MDGSRVFDPEVTRFLESGCALIVGTVGPDGAPHAGRAWGLDVRTADGQPRLRLLLDAEDARTVEHAIDGPLAVTATNVRTLRSVQLKCRSSHPEAATAEDVARAGRYIHEFFNDIMATDGTAPALVARIEPSGYVACTLEVLERFDQTPGPGAGARVGGAP